MTSRTTGAAWRPLDWRIVVTTLVALAIAITGLLSLSSGARASSVEPVLVAGNPSCTSLGYDFGFKPQPEPPPSGVYTIPGTSETITIVSDGTYFDWSSTMGMDAVIVKGGSNANVYYYDPESMGDTGLHSPANSSGGYAAISHIEFCYDFEVDVTKTATTSYTRTWNWTIDKSVTPETWNLFTGDSGTSQYTVAVTKTGYTDSDWAVNGSITIDNNTPFAATITGVSDVISGDINAPVDCGVTLPYNLAAGGTLNCTYSAALPDGTNRVNTATVTTTGTVGGGSDTADVIFGDPTTVVNGTINVDDTNGGSWSFSDSGSVSYPRTFTCDADEGTHDNTATIRETGQSDSAAVTVNCYALAVTKDVDPSFDRDWEWTIEKSADQTDLLLSEGQLFEVNYEVTVSALAVDSNHAISGSIAVNNPAPMAATINSVNDIVSLAIAATVDCGVEFPYTLPAGGTLECDYSADLPDDADRTNTVAATLQNYAYDSAGVGTANGTTDFTGSAAVSFSDATMTETDECIDVSDTNTGVLGTVCAADAPETFSYSLWFGAHPDADVVLECGDNTHVNTASFVANDTGATGSSSWTVNANVACGAGCTLTQGYWKTHSENGPAPYDDAWLNLGDADGDGNVEGSGETFFLSGMTYYEVLWTAPQGNVYYNLAHQYIAATLNVANGASTTADVENALSWATEFFSSTTPGQGAALKGSAKNTANSYASILDQYNNGLIGPGHCSE